MIFLNAVSSLGARDDADNDAVGTNVHAEVYLVDAVFDAGTVACADGVDGVLN